MSILDWFKRTGQKKQPAEPIALVAPWRREVLGVIYCSDVCYANAGRGMLASQGKSKPCCFCQTEVTYGHSGIVYMPFLTEPNLVCARCHEKAEHWNATQKECALCGKAYDPRHVTTTAAPSESRCASCSKEITDWHFDFESIEMAPRLGEQCSACGQVVCKEHSEERCVACGGETVMLLKGPAYSSMVSDARQRGKYNRFILTPTKSNRVVVQE